MHDLRPDPRTIPVPLASPAGVADAGAFRPVVDIVVPVYNEEHVARPEHRAAPRVPRRASSRSRGGSRSSTTRRPTARGAARRASRASSRTSAPATSTQGSRAARCARRGPRVDATSSRTWTSTSRPTSTRSSRSSRRSCPVTPTSRSAPGSRPASSVARGPKRELISRTLQPDPAHRARDPRARRAVRLQGGAGRRRAAAAPGGRGRRLVLRHRAARCSPSTTACASTRCRSTGSTTPTAACT